ncbi:MAG TPA: hypothetical protein VFB20_13795 [Burkholderiales bacterium]|nr:hypothetical protein [Burkholderiales bacterium]
MGYEISIDDRNGIAEIPLEHMPHNEHEKAGDELLEIYQGRGIYKVLIGARRDVAMSGARCFRPEGTDERNAR